MTNATSLSASDIADTYRAMRNRRVLASLLLLAFVAPAQATSLLDGVGDKLGVTSGPSSTSVAPGKTGADYNALEAQADAAWRAMPMSTRHALFVKKKGDGFGIYEPRPNNEFAPGETLFIYAEPIGFLWVPEGDHFGFGVTADLAIKDSEDNTLFEKEGFAKLPLTSRERNKEFMLNFDVTVTGLKPGPYKLEVVLHDLNSAKTTSFGLPFKIGPKS